MNDNITEKLKKGKVEKKRYWRIVCYPESAPENWIEIVRERMIPFAISPLHDKDLVEDGDSKGIAYKKAHYHILLAYQNTTTFDNVKRIADSINAVFPLSADNLKKAYEYLWHKNDHDKYPYRKEDVKCFNGFNIRDFSELEKSEVHKIKIEIQTLIRQKDIKEYAHLLDYLLDNNMMDEHEIACSNTIMLRSYLSSRRHSSTESTKKIDTSKLVKEVLE